MAGPWERYQPPSAQQDGPWARYAQPSEPEQDFSFKPERDMTALQRVAAGVGKGVTDVLQGAGQMVGLADRAQVQEKRDRDRALMETTGGKVGSFAGQIAALLPTALIPGANTVTGAALIGAGTGLAQPSTSTGETLANVALGGVGGAGGQMLANKIGGAIQSGAQNAAQQAQRNTQAISQRMAAAQNAHDLGYVIPPADLNPGTLTEALSGLSGKIKTAQVASQRNQAVTDDLARKALGMSAGDDLTREALASIRQQAGQAYQVVAGTGAVKPGPSYTAALDDAIKPFVSQANSFPGRKLPRVVEDVEALKTGQFDAGDAVEAIKVLRSDADAAYRAGDSLAGKAYKKASQALEDALDDHMQKIGAPADVLKAYREARQTIAKTYTVEKALNSEIGAVNAQKLAKDLERGKPLSGELKSIAEVAYAFPRATQALKETPKAWSPLDFAVGGVGASFGGPLAAAMAAGRPLARSVLLSPTVQRSAVNNTRVPQSVGMGLLSQSAPLLERGGLPLGITGGLLAYPRE